MCSARSSTSSASPITTSSIACSNSSGNRDMCTPFVAPSRSTVQSMVAAISFSLSPWRILIAFSTPVTPARERAIRTSGTEAWMSSTVRCRRSAIPSGVSCRNLAGGWMTEDPTFPKLVSLACHDLRTPLATVNGFARTLERMDGLDPTTLRYLGMISAAAGQMARLLEGLGLAANVEGGRYDPGLTEVDSRELADSAAETLGPERVAVSGEGALVRVDAPAARIAVEDLARCALRHGGLERVQLHAAGPALELSPVTPSSAPVLLGEDLRDLGAAVAGLALRAAGATIELRGELLGIVLPAAK